jgi:uncharacterized membrane protein YeaQ/YmgE (transglycosylase-associated protein family)
MFEFAINMGLGAWVVIIIAALVFGLVAQFVGEPHTGYEWFVDALAFGVGAVAASEFVTAWRAVEPVWDNLALIPAIGGGLVVGLIVEVATRLVTGGTYRSSDRPLSI